MPALTSRTRFEVVIHRRVRSVWASTTDNRTAPPPHQGEVPPILSRTADQSLFGKVRGTSLGSTAGMSIVREDGAAIIIASRPFFQNRLLT